MGHTRIFKEEEAKEALRMAIPDIDVYLKNGQIEIISRADWHVKDGSLDPQMLLNHLIDKINQALDNGYDGLRYCGNIFCGHEKTLDYAIGKYPVISLCTYSLDKYNITKYNYFS